MTEVIWDPKAREFLRKLPKDISRRIFRKIDLEVKENPERYLKSLVDIEANKIRIGDYRVFAEYFKDKNLLIIRAIRHRKNAYKF